MYGILFIIYYIIEVIAWTVSRSVPGSGNGVVGSLVVAAEETQSQYHIYKRAN